MTNYKSAVERINKAKNKSDLDRAQLGFDRVFKAGFLTVSELRRLDGKVLQKLIELGEI